MRFKGLGLRAWPFDPTGRVQGFKGSGYKGSEFKGLSAFGGLSEFKVQKLEGLNFRTVSM